MKIVLNKCYGGFHVSERLKKILGANTEKYYDYQNRNAPELVQAVEELGEQDYDSFTRLRVVEVPNDTRISYNEFQGMEFVAYKKGDRVEYA